MKKIREIENFLQDGKLPDQDVTPFRKGTWRHVINAQRARRRARPLLKVPPWTWALASIILVLLFVFFVLYVK